MFVIRRNDSGLHSSAVIGCFYARGQLEYIERWLFNNENRLGLERILGDYWENAKDLTVDTTDIEHVYYLVGGIFQRINNVELRTPIEDLSSYCRLFLWGIEAPLKLGEDMERILGMKGSVKFVWDTIKEYY
jgi:hypothetical protein